MVHYHNIDQNSEDWHKIRLGRLTASNATAIGANGTGLITYCKKLAIEIITNKREETYTSEAMVRGTELEPLALSAYEFETGNKVKTIGFVTNCDYYNSGCSPDGLVDKDKSNDGEGGIEIKFRNKEKHLSLIVGETKEIPFNQIQMNLLFTERKWWDFISFNPEFDKPLFIKRIYPDEKYFEKLKSGIRSGNVLINKYIDIYNNFKNE